jgi:hypothetical protein
VRYRCKNCKPPDTAVNKNINDSKNKSSSTGVLGNGKCLGAAGCSRTGRVGTAAPKAVYLLVDTSLPNPDIIAGIELRNVRGRRLLLLGIDAL